MSNLFDSPHLVELPYPLPSTPPSMSSQELPDTLLGHETAQHSDERYVFGTPIGRGEVRSSESDAQGAYTHWSSSPVTGGRGEFNFTPSPSYPATAHSSRQVVPLPSRGALQDRRCVPQASQAPSSPAPASASDFAHAAQQSARSQLQAELNTPRPGDEEKENRKRRRSGDDEDGAKRKQKKPEDPYAGMGRYFGRNIHAVANIGQVIAEGISRLGKRRADPETAERSLYADKMHLHYLAFTRDQPWVLDMFAKYGADKKTCDDVVAQMTRGQGQARSTDLSNIKSHLSYFIFDGAHLANPNPGKSGFENDHTTWLLAPHRLLHKKTPEVLEQLKYQKERIEVDGLSVSNLICEWKIFAYAEDAADPNDDMTGLFMGKLLFSVATLILYGESTAKNNVTTFYELAPRNTCNMVKMLMRRIRPAFVAYVVTLTYHALFNSSKQFNWQGWRLILYKHVLQFFEDHRPAYKEHANRVLNAWHKRFFGGGPPTLPQSEDTFINEDPSLRNMRSKLYDYNYLWSIEEGGPPVGGTDDGGYQ